MNPGKVKAREGRFIHPLSLILNDVVFQEISVFQQMTCDSAASFSDTDIDYLVA